MHQHLNKIKANLAYPQLILQDHMIHSKRKNRVK